MNRGAMRSKRTRFSFIAFLMLLLMVSVVALTGGTAVAALSASEMGLQKLGPALQAIITEQTNNQIPIIVQKETSSTQAEQAVVTLGGNIVAWRHTRH